MAWENWNWSNPESGAERALYEMAEDLRRWCWLSFNRIDAALVHELYKTNNTWLDKILPYGTTDEREPPHDTHKWWIPRTKLGQTFSNGGCFGGGTVWYEESYGPYTIQEIDLENQKIKLSGDKWETDPEGSGVRQFRPDSPLMLTGSTKNLNDGFYRVDGTPEVISGDTWIKLKPGNDGDDLALVSNGGTLGSVECDFGGDFYATNAQFVFNDCVFKSTNNNIFSVSGKDIRPPAGGPQSWDEDPDNLWIRTAVPWKYCHWGRNSHRKIVFSWRDTDTGAIYSWRTETYKFFPRQTDPGEQEAPVLFWDTQRVSRNHWGKDNVELTADHITLADSMGAIASIIEDMDYSVDSGNFPQNKNQYLSWIKYIEDHDQPEMLQPDNANIYSAIRDAHIAPKMTAVARDFACYQAMIEYYASETTWYWETESGVNGVGAAYQSNWLDFYKNYTDPKSEETPKEKYYQTRDWAPLFDENQELYAPMQSFLWGENGSAFELGLALLGHYDYYYDYDHPYSGDLLDIRDDDREASAPLFVPPQSHTRWDRNGVSHNVNNVIDYVDYNYPMPIGTLRKIWLYTYNYKNRHCLRAHEAGPITDQDVGNGSSSTAEYDGHINNSRPFEFAGRYRYEHPSRTDFRNFNFSINTIENEFTFTVTGNQVSTNRGIDGKAFFRGGKVQLYDTTDDELVTDCLGNFGIVNVWYDTVTHVRVAQSLAAWQGSYSTIEVQGDTRVMRRHDPLFIDTEGNEYYGDINIDMWKDMHNILEFFKYQIQDVSVQKLYDKRSINAGYPFDYPGALEGSNPYTLLQAFWAWAENEMLTQDPSNFVTPNYEIWKMGSCFENDGTWGIYDAFYNTHAFKVSAGGYTLDTFRRASAGVLYLSIVASCSIEIEEGDPGYDYYDSLGFEIPGYTEEIKPVRSYTAENTLYFKTVYMWVRLDVNTDPDAEDQYYVGILGNIEYWFAESDAVLAWAESNISTHLTSGNMLLEFNWDGFSEDCWAKDSTRAWIIAVDPQG